MNFKYFVLLVLTISILTAQAERKPELVCSGTNHNAEMSFESQPKRHLSAYERHDFLNVNHRMPGYDPIPSGPCPLSLLEIDLLPRPLQKHPEVIAQKERLLSARKASEPSKYEKELTLQALPKSEQATEKTAIKTCTNKQTHQITKEQTEYQQYMPAAMQKPDAAFEAYCQIYQELEVEKLYGIDAYRRNMLERRKSTLTAWERKCDEYQEKTYHLIDKAQEFLHKFSMKTADFLTCYGNPFQHLLHQEFVDIVQDTAQWHYDQNTHSRDREAITTTLMRFVETGQLYNRTGQLGNAFSCADFCWGLLDCTKAAIQYGGKLTISALKGVARGTTNCFFKAIQLPRTFREMTEEVQYAVLLAGHHLIQIREESKIAFTKTIEQILQDQHDLSIGAITKWDIIQRDLDSLKHNFNQTVEEVYSDLYFVWQSLESEKILLGTEKIFEIGTEIYLTGKATNGINALFKNSCDSLGEIIQSGGGAGNFHDLPLNGSTLQAYIAYESIFAHQAAQAVREASICAADAIDKTAKMLPPLILMSNSPPENDGPNNPTSGAILNPPIDIIQAMQPLSDAERAELDKYIGLATHNGHPVIPPFDHLWVATAVRNGTRISGFHQDRLGFYRELGLISDVEMMAEDFYTAKVLLNGKWIKRSYFPERWLPDELMKCFYEVINNQEIVEFNELRTTFEMTRPSGIKITVVIENTGKGITFFPNLIP